MCRQTSTTFKEYDMNTKKIHEFSREEYEAYSVGNKSLPNKYKAESFVSFVLSVHRMAFLYLVGVVGLSMIIAIVLTTPLALLTLYDFLIHIESYEQVVVLLAMTGLLGFGWLIYKKSIINTLKKGLMFLIEKLMFLGPFIVFFLLVYSLSTGLFTMAQVLGLEMTLMSLYTLIFKM